MSADAPRGVWLGASYALGRPVPVDGPYPHVCHVKVIGTVTGVRFRTQQRDCAACAQMAFEAKQARAS